MNNVTLIGRLTHDPEARKTGDGLTVCNFNLAVDDTYSREDRADFIRIAVFGTQGDNCMKYLRKGFLAGVSGRIRSDKYTDADGVKRYPIDIVAERVQFLQWPDRKEAAAATPLPAAPVTTVATEPAAEEQIAV
jgi:single-strand DNA-binding protein